LLDEVEKYYQNRISKEEFLIKNGLPNKPIIAILPGSRKQEIHVKLPIMLEAVSTYTDYQVLIAGAPNQVSEMYQQFENSNCTIIFGQTYDLVSHAEVAIVTSGTATLETAILNIPEVVCYKGSWISYFIARSLIKINYISLVNLIMDQLVVKELIQAECNAEQIRKELNLLLSDETYRNTMLDNYELLRQKLGGVGASENVAKSLLKTIQGQD
jgi:lipid-A-disaccharide synthase